jgi:hypothetical protein
MMRPFRPAERHNAVFRPVDDKGFSLNLGEPMRIICPETLPPVFAPLQLAKGRTRACSPGKTNNFVENFVAQKFLSAKQRTAHSSPRERSTSQEKRPPQLIDEWQTHRQVR